MSTFDSAVRALLSLAFNALAFVLYVVSRGTGTCAGDGATGGVGGALLEPVLPELPPDPPPPELPAPELPPPPEPPPPPVLPPPPKP
ncbi:MAG: hypothetical protein ACRDVC_06495, partial [Acidimicrobiales bacterium]